jgi:hypothetical protein
MEAVYSDCTLACEFAPQCRTCGRIKKPRGRDSMDNGRCDSDCPGYKEDPAPGHLWPGEIARARAENQEP